MAAWQRLAAGAACAGQGAPCPQFLRLSTSRSVGLYNLCCGMCRGSGLFPCEGEGCCREGGTAARAFRNNCAHRSIPRSPPRSSPGQALCREQPSAQNRTRSHGGGENQTNQQQNQSASAVPGWRCSAVGAAALGACSVPARPGAPGPRWSQR